MPIDVSLFSPRTIPVGILVFSLGIAESYV